MTDSPKKLTNFERTLSEEDKKKIAERRREYARRRFVVLANIEYRDDRNVTMNALELPIGRISSPTMRRQYMHDVETTKVSERVGTEEPPVYRDRFFRNPPIRSWSKETGQLTEVVVHSRSLSVKQYRHERDGDVTI